MTLLEKHRFEKTLLKMCGPAQRNLRALRKFLRDNLSDKSPGIGRLLNDLEVAEVAIEESYATALEEIGRTK